MFFIYQERKQQPSLIEPTLVLSVPPPELQHFVKISFPAAVYFLTVETGKVFFHCGGF